MSLSVIWHPRAEQRLREVSSWQKASDIVVAVDRFAANADGEVYIGEHPGDYRLVVGRYRVRFTIDLTADRLDVWDVLRRA